MQLMKRRILCVDEYDDTRFMLVNLFELSNYEVITASSVKDGLRLAQSERFDLYILERRFNEGSGVDLCREIRKLHPKTPIIFYSGDVYEADQQEALSAGAQAYLTKPGDVGELVNCAHRLLAERKDAVTSG